MLKWWSPKAEDILLQQMIDIGPDKPFTHQFAVPAGTQETELRAALVAADGKELIAYQPVHREAGDQAAGAGQGSSETRGDHSRIEELFLTGLRIEQIHNPRVDPMPYYQEALRRDPGDSRSNIMLGINYNKRGRYAEAETHLRKAVERLTMDYTRSRTGEAHFQLGVSLLAQHRDDEAYEQFYRASLGSGVSHGRLLRTGRHLLPPRRLCPGGRATSSRRSPRTRSTPRRLNLQAAVLRRLGRPAEAAQIAARALEIDPLDFWARQRTLPRPSRSGPDSDLAGTSLQQLTHLMRDEVQSYLELATDYMHAGLFSEAMDVLQSSSSRPTSARPASIRSCTITSGYLHQQLGHADAARECFARAAQMPTDYCFPFRLETIDVLQAALAVHPDDAHAEYLLGNLLFDLQPAVAIEHWERSRSLDKSLAMVHRNLGWAYYRVKNDVPKAIEGYEQALSCNQLEPRLLLELDQLYEDANVRPATTLGRPAGQSRRCRAAGRQLPAGNHGPGSRRPVRNRPWRAWRTTSFTPKKDATRSTTCMSTRTCWRACACSSSPRRRRRCKHFRKAAEYPENLSVGRPKNDPRAPQIAYCAGLACEALGDRSRPRSTSRSRRASRKPSRGLKPGSTRR